MSKRFTKAMDDAIQAAWPELATFEGIYPDQVRTRARTIGLRLDPAEGRRRTRKAFAQAMGKRQKKDTNT